MWKLECLASAVRHSNMWGDARRARTTHWVGTTVLGVNLAGAQFAACSCAATAAACCFSAAVVVVAVFARKELPASGHALPLYALGCMTPYISNAYRVLQAVTPLQRGRNARGCSHSSVCKE